jgi:hypothetical protein
MVAVNKEATEPGVSSELPRICSVCCNYNPVLSLIINYQLVCNKSNTADATSDEGTPYSSWNTLVHPHFLVGFVLLFSFLCSVL